VIVGAAAKLPESWRLKCKQFVKGMIVKEI
jgi:hypothetical protein